jgi:hypothetical protein
MALIEGLAGSGSRPLLHTSGSSVIADNSRGDYASNHLFGFSWRVMTPVMTEAIPYNPQFPREWDSSFVRLLI